MSFRVPLLLRLISSLVGSCIQLLCCVVQLGLIQYIVADKNFTVALNSLPQICEPLGKLLDSEDEAIRLLAAKVVILLVMYAT
jgi:hypothetical protein